MDGSGGLPRGLSVHAREIVDSARLGVTSRKGVMYQHDGREAGISPFPTVASVTWRIENESDRKPRYIRGDLPTRQILPDVACRIRTSLST